MSASDAMATNGNDTRLDWEDDKSVLGWMENKVRQITACFCGVCLNNLVIRSIFWIGTLNVFDCCILSHVQSSCTDP